MKEKIINIWRKLYSNNEEMLQIFFEFLDESKENFIPYFENDSRDWYKDSIIYSLYVDLFNEDIEGLIEKLSYLEKLGINCIWLLPILESPMMDAGFDISDYKKIRPSLLRFNEQKVFEVFLNETHRRGIRVIFDIALNHCSDKHPWFEEARKNKDNSRRDYFIWNENYKKYEKARIIFKGLCKSNWEFDADSGVNLISANMLGDTTCFTACNVGVTNRV